MIEWLFKIYNMVWRMGVAPEDWQKPLLCPSIRRVLGGNVGIIEGSPWYVSWEKCSQILNDQVRLMTDNRLLEEQAGFRLSIEGTLIKSL